MQSIRNCAILAPILMAFLFGCDKSPSGSGPAKPAASASKASFGPESSAVSPSLKEGWCAGHGVPESVCTRCHDKLIEQFKKAGDWCAEHGLPESQCAKCHPEVTAKWAALKPKESDSEAPSEPRPDAKPATTQTAFGPESSAIKPVMDEGWCAGHGVPESVCTRCHKKLIEKFKEGHDWCAEHELPESQC